MIIYKTPPKMLTITIQLLQRENDIQSLIRTLEQQGKTYFNIRLMLESVFGLTPQQAKERLRK